MDQLEVGQSKLKPLAATLGERLGRLKLNGRLWGYSPLSRLDDLGHFDLGALAERATEQLRRLETLHLKAAAPCS